MLPHQQREGNVKDLREEKGTVSGIFSINSQDSGLTMTDDGLVQMLGAYKNGLIIQETEHNFMNHIVLGGPIHLALKIRDILSYSETSESLPTPFNQGQVRSGPYSKQGGWEPSLLPKARCSRPRRIMQAAAGACSSF